MPAEYARFKRAEFQAALKKRGQQLSNSGCYPFFVLGWMLCSAAVFRLLLSGFDGEGEEWWHLLLVPLLFLFVLGPPVLLPYSARRSLRPFLKCPGCKRPTHKHDNQRYILATGKCGWCGNEVLEPAPSYEPAIPPITPRSTFEKISLPDLIAEQAKNAPWGRKHNTAFAILYVGGLLPFLALFHGAATYGMPTVSMVLPPLWVFWLLLSPRLWLKVLRQRQLNHSRHCPHCRESLDHMLAIVTGRCGSCGVEVVESGGRSSAETLPFQNGLSSGDGQSEDFAKLSRAGFMALRRTVARERREDATDTVKRLLPYLGSSLVVIIVSILVLPAPWNLTVPLVWILGAGAVYQFIFGRQLQRILKSRSESSNATFFNCPACWKSTGHLNGSFLVTTGRCGECLSAVLDDDTARASSHA
ncbi:MAG TPA: hypothetical protein VLE43_13635 [Candidatus Saccharimonadia bacterium]|nr:hypothetical protein [Candidatus Saccharimonadia bacterium]